MPPLQGPPSPYEPTPAGPRIDLTVRLSREGKLDAVTYADFYLLAADPKELLKAAGLRLNRDLSDGEDEGEALIAEFVRVAGMARTGVFSGDSEYLREFNKKATWALMPHLVATATTNEDGRLTLRAAKPGSYYLMGGAQPPAHAVWDVPLSSTETKFPSNSTARTRWPRRGRTMRTNRRAPQNHPLPPSLTHR